MSTPSKARSDLLRTHAQCFCAAFLDLPSNPPTKILSEHFTSSLTPRITEHGPSWSNAELPFLGRTFTGRDQCGEYFSLLADVLAFEPSSDTFPGSEGFVVDPEAVGPNDEDLAGQGGQPQGGKGRGVVSVVAKARFRAVKTGQSWEEQFIYRLSGFDDEGRIGHWEIWADPLSAWLAVQGKLPEGQTSR